MGIGDSMTSFKASYNRCNEERRGKTSEKRK